MLIRCCSIFTTFTHLEIALNCIGIIFVAAIITNRLLMKPSIYFVLIVLGIALALNACKKDPDNTGIIPATDTTTKPIKTLAGNYWCNVKSTIKKTQLNGATGQWMYDTTITWSVDSFEAELTHVDTFVVLKFSTGSSAARKKSENVYEVQDAHTYSSSLFRVLYYPFADSIYSSSYYTSGPSNNNTSSLTEYFALRKK